MRLRFALLLLVAACNSSSLARRTTNPNPPSGTLTGSTAQTPSGGSTSAPVDPAVQQKLNEVEAEVAANNATEAADSNGFVAAGWAFVEGVKQPEDALLAYDPALLGQRDAELRMQLASTTPKVGDIANLAAIIRQTTNEDMRATAIDALGRINDEGAGQTLFILLTSGAIAAGDGSRAMIASLLQPENLDASLAAQMVGALDRSDLSLVERNQIAANLAMLSLRDSQAIQGLSPAGAALVEQAKALLTGTTH